MYPDLSYFFNDVFGTNPDNWTSIFKTFGFMLVVALICCGVMLKSELRRREQEGLIKPIKVVIKESDQLSLSEIIMNVLFILFAGTKIPFIIQNFDLFKGDPASVLFSKSGYWLIGILLAVIAAAYYFWKNNTSDKKPKFTETLQYPSEKTNDIIIIAGLSGVLGSKLFSVFEDLQGFFQDPLGQLLSGSGLNVYGGLILAFFVVYRYVKKIGINPVYMMDIGGMGILLGYAVGRIGCQLSGDGDWGIVAAAQPDWWIFPDWLWSYNYPNNVNNEGVLLSQCDIQAYNATLTERMPIEDRCLKACGIRYCHELSPGVYPTPVYETTISLLAFGILWLFRRKFTLAGTIFFIYMIFNGVERFLIEMIRVNEKYELLGLNWSQAQYISVLFVLIGIAGLIYLFTKGKKEG
ncbi:MAG: prolipoprotein diacylglyceryl transferase [Saprospiraceae bacterium]|nr:prolipoprotein diacylglyceryl transferase [Saprospiraceae bacterium]